MESYLQITQLNDFVFCPRSIYFSGIYRNTVSPSCYNGLPQVRGGLAHQNVDEGIYSSRKNIITGMMVYSEKYRLLGRIDVYDADRQLLTERKYSVTAVYDGFRYQLYAQFFALQEMGYEVRQMRIHSLKDNRNYDVPLPGEQEIVEFENLLERMNSYSLLEDFTQNLEKCRNCIYRSLCDYYLDSGEEDADIT